jgi:tetratricopeptide (TPR) repeat protein
VDLIATAFVLLATYAGILLQERPTLWRWLGGLGAFAMALLSKEPAVVLPGILILLWRSRGEPWRSSVGRLVPFLFVLIAYVGLRRIVLSRTVGFAFAFDHLAIRAVGLMIILLEYLRVFAWPGFLPNFHMAVSSETLTVPALIAGVLFVFTGVALSFGARRRGKCACASSWLPVRVGMLWFLLALAPVIGVVWAKEAPKVGFLVTERYLYLPALGLCIVAAWGLIWLSARASWVLGGVAVLLLVISGGAVVRALEWRDAETMYRAILPRTGDRTLAHANLGALYLNRGETEAAISEFESVLREDPTHAITLNNLGVARARQGRIDEALVLHREAIRRKPAYADAWNNLGVLLEARGETAEARIAYQRALTIDPTLEQALRNLEELQVKAATSGGNRR